MKRNMGLLRAILLRLEETESFGRAEEHGVGAEEYLGHVKLLEEGGFVEGAKFYIEGAPPVIALATEGWLRITWRGHEFLDAARDPEVWEEAMSRTSKVSGTVGFGVLKKVLSELALEKLGQGGA